MTRSGSFRDRKRARVEDKNVEQEETVVDAMMIVRRIQKSMEIMEH